MTSFFKHFKADILGGITAGIVALPLALAFGVSSGLGASAGLYGAIFIGFFASLFGGTNTQISGPTAPMTAVSMVVIAGIIAVNNGNIEKAIPTILTVFLLAGLMQIGLGLLGFGKYIKYIPYPVVSGFMTAIGVIILVTQLMPALGYYPNEDDDLIEKYTLKAEQSLLSKMIEEEAKDGVLVIDDFERTITYGRALSDADVQKETRVLIKSASSGVLGALKTLPRAFKNIDLLELGMALVTIFIVFGFKRITTKIPSALVALVVVSGVAYALGWDYRPIAKIPAGLPIPNISIFTEFRLTSVTPYIFTALTLALLGAIDSLLTSIVADNMTKTKHQPNKELVGQGIGNSVAAVFGGLPGAGATIRTVVNINAGGKTRLSGMIAGLLLLIVLLAIGPIASKIPAAVLAGILITVGIGVMDYKGLKAIPILPKDTKIGPIKFSSEVVIMLVVLILSSLWNLVYAVGVGLVLASLFFMKRIGDLSIENSDVKNLKEESWPDEQGFPELLKEEVFIKHIKGPLFFGNTSDFQVLSKQIPETATTVIIRLELTPYIDQSGLYTMEDILINLKKRGVTVLLVGIAKQPKYMMERIGLVPQLIPANHIFETFQDCLSWIKLNVKDNK
ncbi:MAG: SulP family inorganic anion transporter [Psychroserpens sp.]|uniref:SulP family inorganic anion transporter n=1 Tax=Psychroserpens sp. TaxID=2020870 RepID=UPI003C7097D9